MDIQDLAGRIQTGERRALARAITLVESGRGITVPRLPNCWRR